MAPVASVKDFVVMEWRCGESGDSANSRLLVKQGGLGVARVGGAHRLEDPHAMMTLFWHRRAATISKNVPMAKSARPSIHRCWIPAPRRIIPRVMLMK